jgi:hypothetical protein
MRSRKLDGRFYAFTSRRSKKGLTQPSASPCTQPFRQFPGQIRYMGLNHRRATACKLSLQRIDDIWVVVPNILNAIARQEIQDPATVCSEQLRSYAPFVPDVHLEQAEQTHPLWIDTLRVPR